MKKSECYRYHVALVDNLPAGFEPINPNLTKKPEEKMYGSVGFCRALMPSLQAAILVVQAQQLPRQPRRGLLRPHSYGIIRLPFAAPHVRRCFLQMKAHTSSRTMPWRPVRANTLLHRPKRKKCNACHVLHCCPQPFFRCRYQPETFGRSSSLTVHIA